jgi:hypothetical protein
MTMTQVLSIAAAGAVVSTQVDTMGQFGNEVLDIARVAATRYELAVMRTAVTTEIALGRTAAVQSDFRGFLRSNFESGEDDPSLDPWGHPYVFRQHPEHWELRSYGPDGRGGTEDDMRVVISR